MGYHLNSLANLPVDADVFFYVFVVHENFHEPLFEMIQKNFLEIARSTGKHAVIAQGLNPISWNEEVATKYLGKNHAAYSALLPALLITNAHPDNVLPTTMRLFVPLSGVEKRFGGWPVFFKLLTEFLQMKNHQFVDRFQATDWAGNADKWLEAKPGAFGFAVNLNEILKWFRE